MQEHLDDFLEEVRQRTAHGFGLPAHVERQFKKYLDCGLLDRGFVRVRCHDCHYERLVAFSCKSRAFCPSCTARRMDDTAAHLVRCVLPHVPYRQWVLSLPRFNVGAGWCQPCIEETLVIENDLHAPFCARGLRIVQVLFQDEESRAATKLFCRDWRDRYGLRFPVLVDPLFTTSRYFEAAQTPLNLLVDRNGNIVFRTVGVAPADLAQRIDMLLP